MATATETEVCQHPLAHLIPEPTGYISRKVLGSPIVNSSGQPTGEVRGGKADLNVLAYCARRSAADEGIYGLALTGPTGSGKTNVVEQFASIKDEEHPFGRPVVTLSGSDGWDSLKLFGGYIPDPAAPGGARWQDGEVLTVIKHGGILNLDEINFVSGAETAILHSLLDRRRGVTVFDLGNEWVPAHPDLFVIATYNEGAGYAGTRQLNDAFSNRFPLHIDWDYDRNVELALTGSPTLVNLAWEIRNLGKQGGIKTPLPTNQLVNFCTLAFDVDVRFALEAFLTRFKESERPIIRERIEIESLLRSIVSEIDTHFGSNNI